MKRTISLITTVFFLFSNALALPVTELAGGRSLPSRGSGIPESLGTVSSAYDTGGTDAVAVILDLHCDPGVQRQIRNILEHVSQKSALKTVFTEGGAGRMDTRWIECVGDEATREAFVNSLLEDGRLSGAEYFSIGRKHDIDLEGLEDRGTHRQNLARLRVIRENKDIDSILEEMEGELLLAERRHAGNAFELLLQKKPGKGRQYYRRLIKDAKFSRIDLSYYPDLTAYAELATAAGGYGYRRAAGELQSVVKKLRETMPYGEFRELSERTGSFSDLKALSDEQDLIKRYCDISGKRTLEKILKAGRNARDMDPAGASVEERLLSRDIEWRRGKNEQERERAFLRDYFESYKDFWKGKISAAEYRYVTVNEGLFEESWIRNIGNDAYHELDIYRPLVQDYYRVNEERTRLFFQNICKGMQAGGCKTVSTGTEAAAQILDQGRTLRAVVMGGFHADALVRELQTAGIPHLVIIPAIKSDISRAERSYEKILHEQGINIALASDGDDPVTQIRLAGCFLADTLLSREMDPDAVAEAIKTAAVRLAEIRRGTEETDETDEAIRSDPPARRDDRVIFNVYEGETRVEIICTKPDGIWKAASENIEFSEGKQKTAEDTKVTAMGHNITLLLREAFPGIDIVSEWSVRLAELFQRSVIPQDKLGAMQGIVDMIMEESKAYPEKYPGVPPLRDVKVSANPDDLSLEFIDPSGKQAATTAWAMALLVGNDDGTSTLFVHKAWVLSLLKLSDEERRDRIRRLLAHEAREYETYYGKGEEHQAFKKYLDENIPEDPQALPDMYHKYLKMSFFWFKKNKAVTEEERKAHTEAKNAARNVRKQKNSDIVYESPSDAIFNAVGDVLASSSLFARGGNSRRHITSLSFNLIELLLEAFPGTSAPIMAAEWSVKLAEIYENKAALLDDEDARIYSPVLDSMREKAEEYYSREIGDRPVSSVSVQVNNDPRLAREDKWSLGMMKVTDNGDGTVSVSIIIFEPFAIALNGLSDEERDFYIAEFVSHEMKEHKALIRQEGSDFALIKQAKADSLGIRDRLEIDALELNPDDFHTHVALKDPGQVRLYEFCQKAVSDVRDNGVSLARREALASSIAGVLKNGNGNGNSLSLSIYNSAIPGVSQKLAAMDAEDLERLNKDGIITGNFMAAVLSGRPERVKQLSDRDILTTRKWIKGALDEYQGSLLPKGISQFGRANLYHEGDISSLWAKYSDIPERYRTEFLKEKGIAGYEQSCRQMLELEERYPDASWGDIYDAVANGSTGLLKTTIEEDDGFLDEGDGMEGGDLPGYSGESEPGKGKEVTLAPDTEPKQIRPRRVPRKRTRRKKSDLMQVSDAQETIQSIKTMVEAMRGKDRIIDKISVAQSGVSPKKKGTLTSLQRAQLSLLEELLDQFATEQEKERWGEQARAAVHILMNQAPGSLALMIAIGGFDDETAYAIASQSPAAVEKLSDENKKDLARYIWDMAASYENGYWYVGKKLLLKADVLETISRETEMPVGRVAEAINHNTAAYVEQLLAESKKFQSEGQMRGRILLALIGKLKSHTSISEMLKEADMAGYAVNPAARRSAKIQAQKKKLLDFAGQRGFAEKYPAAVEQLLVQDLYSLAMMVVIGGLDVEAAAEIAGGELSDRGKEKAMRYLDAVLSSYKGEDKDAKDAGLRILLPCEKAAVVGAAAGFQPAETFSVIHQFNLYYYDVFRNACHITAEVRDVVPFSGILAACQRARTVEGTRALLSDAVRHERRVMEKRIRHFKSLLKDPERTALKPAKAEKILSADKRYLNGKIVRYVCEIVEQTAGISEGDGPGSRAESIERLLSSLTFYGLARLVAAGEIEGNAALALVTRDPGRLRVMSAAEKRLMAYQLVVLLPGDGGDKAAARQEIQRLREAKYAWRKAVMLPRHPERALAGPPPISPSEREAWKKRADELDKMYESILPLEIRQRLLGDYSTSFLEDLESAAEEYRAEIEENRKSFRDAVREMQAKNDYHGMLAVAHQRLAFGSKSGISDLERELAASLNERAREYSVNRFGPEEWSQSETLVMQAVDSLMRRDLGTLAVVIVIGGLNPRAGAAFAGRHPLSFKALSQEDKDELARYLSEWAQSFRGQGDRIRKIGLNLLIPYEQLNRFLDDGPPVLPRSVLMKYIGDIETYFPSIAAAVKLKDDFKDLVPEDEINEILRRSSLRKARQYLEAAAERERKKAAGRVQTVKTMAAAMRSQKRVIDQLSIAQSLPNATRSTINSLQKEQLSRLEKILFQYASEGEKQRWGEQAGNAVNTLMRQHPGSLALMMVRGGMDEDVICAVAARSPGAVDRLSDEQKRSFARYFWELAGSYEGGRYWFAGKKILLRADFIETISREMAINPYRVADIIHDNPPAYAERLKEEDRELRKEGATRARNLRTIINNLKAGRSITGKLREADMAGGGMGPAVSHRTRIRMRKEALLESAGQQAVETTFSTAVDTLVNQDLYSLAMMVVVGGLDEGAAAEIAGGGELSGTVKKDAVRYLDSVLASYQGQEENTLNAGLRILLPYEKVAGIGTAVDLQPAEIFSIIQQFPSSYYDALRNISQLDQEIREIIPFYGMMSAFSRSKTLDGMQKILKDEVVAERKGMQERIRRFETLLKIAGNPAGSQTTAVPGGAEKVLAGDKLFLKMGMLRQIRSIAAQASGQSERDASGELAEQMEKYLGNVTLYGLARLVAANKIDKEIAIALVRRDPGRIRGMSSTEKKLMAYQLAVLLPDYRGDKGAPRQAVQQLRELPRRVIDRAMQREEEEETMRRYLKKAGKRRIAQAGRILKNELAKISGNGDTAPESPAAEISAFGKTRMGNLTRALTYLSAVPPGDPIGQLSLLAEQGFPTGSFAGRPNRDIHDALLAIIVAQHMTEELPLSEEEVIRAAYSLSILLPGTLAFLSVRGVFGREAALAIAGISGAMVTDLDKDAKRELVTSIAEIIRSYDGKPNVIKDAGLALMIPYGLFHELVDLSGMPPLIVADLITAYTSDPGRALDKASGVHERYKDRVSQNSIRRALRNIEEAGNRLERMVAENDRKAEVVEEAVARLRQIPVNEIGRRYELLEEMDVPLGSIYPANDIQKRIRERIKELLLQRGWGNGPHIDGHIAADIAHRLAYSNIGQLSFIAAEGTIPVEVARAIASQNVNALDKAITPEVVKELKGMALSYEGEGRRRYRRGGLEHLLSLERLEEISNFYGLPRDIGLGILESRSGAGYPEYLRKAQALYSDHAHIVPHIILREALVGSNAETVLQAYVSEHTDSSELVMAVYNAARLVERLNAVNIMTGAAVDASQTVWRAFIASRRNIPEEFYNDALAVKKETARALSLPWRQSVVYMSVNRMFIQDGDCHAFAVSRGLTDNDGHIYAFETETNAEFFYGLRGKSPAERKLLNKALARHEVFEYLTLVKREGLMYPVFRAYLESIGLDADSEDNYTTDIFHDLLDAGVPEGFTANDDQKAFIEDQRILHDYFSERAAAVLEARAADTDPEMPSQDEILERIAALSKMDLKFNGRGSDQISVLDRPLFEILRRMFSENDFLRENRHADELAAKIARSSIAYIEAMYAAGTLTEGQRAKLVAVKQAIEEERTKKHSKRLLTQMNKVFDHYFDPSAPGPAATARAADIAGSLMAKINAAGLDNTGLAERLALVIADYDNGNLSKEHKDILREHLFTRQLAGLLEDRFYLRGASQYMLLKTDNHFYRTILTGLPIVDTIQSRVGGVNKAWLYIIRNLKNGVDEKMIKEILQRPVPDNIPLFVARRRGSRKNDARSPAAKRDAVKSPAPSPEPGPPAAPRKMTLRKSRVLVSKEPVRGRVFPYFKDILSESIGSIGIPAAFEPGLLEVERARLFLMLVDEYFRCEESASCDPGSVLYEKFQEFLLKKYRGLNEGTVAYCKNIFLFNEYIDKLASQREKDPRALSLPETELLKYRVVSDYIADVLKVRYSRFMDEHPEQGAWRSLKGARKYVQFLKKHVFKDTPLNDELAKKFARISPWQCYLLYLTGVVDFQEYMGLLQRDSSLFAEIDCKGLGRRLDKLLIAGRKVKTADAKGIFPPLLEKLFSNIEGKNNSEDPGVRTAWQIQMAQIMNVQLLAGSGISKAVSSWQSKKLVLLLPDKEGSGTRSSVQIPGADIAGVRYGKPRRFSSIVYFPCRVPGSERPAMGRLYLCREGDMPVFFVDMPSSERWHDDQEAREQAVKCLVEILQYKRNDPVARNHFRYIGLSPECWTAIALRGDTRSAGLLPGKGKPEKITAPSSVPEANVMEICDPARMGPSGTLDDAPAYFDELACTGVDTVLFKGLFPESRNVFLTEEKKAAWERVIAAAHERRIKVLFQYPLYGDFSPIQHREYIMQWMRPGFDGVVIDGTTGYEVTERMFVNARNDVASIWPKAVFAFEPAEKDRETAVRWAPGRKCFIVRRMNGSMDIDERHTDNELVIFEGDSTSMDGAARVAVLSRLMELHAPFIAFASGMRNGNPPEKWQYPAERMGDISRHVARFIRNRAMWRSYFASGEDIQIDLDPLFDRQRESELQKIIKNGIDPLLNRQLLTAA